MAFPPSAKRRTRPVGRHPARGSTPQRPAARKIPPMVLPAPDRGESPRDPAFNAALLDHLPATLALDGNGVPVFSNKAFRKLRKPLIKCGFLQESVNGLQWLGIYRGGKAQSAGQIKLSIRDKRQAFAWQCKKTVIQDQALTLLTFQRLEPQGGQIQREQAQVDRLAGPQNRLPASDRLEDVTRLVSDWIWETDPQLILTYVSARIIEVLGLYPRELKGRRLDSLVTGNREAIANLTEKGARRPFRDLEVEMAHRDGTRRIFRLSGLPIYDPHGGQFTGMRGTAADITSLRAREDALVAAKDSAELANRSKTAFLANVSHELRTPLNAVIGFSEIMMGEILGPLGNAQYKSYAQDIHHSAEHLLNLINDILDAAKVEAGNQELVYGLLQPANLVASVCRLMAPRAQAARQTLMVQVPDSLPQIEADERRLKQVLLNLLSNAIKFTPEGGTVRLSARLDPDGGMSFLVTDNGIGIAPEDLERAFAPFQQVDNRLSRQFEGTGLGLPLSAGFMKLHGGSLTLQSRLKVGTTAIAHLPASCIRH